MKILVPDNHGSFMYSLVQYRERTGKYDKISLSPGSLALSQAGILLELIGKYSRTKSIFDVGQQEILSN